MSKLQQLKDQRSALETQTEELQKKSAEHVFEIELDSRSDIKAITEHLNKGFTWKTQNAAVVVTLHDRLKSQYKDAAENEESVTIGLRGHELNGLYQALLNVEGTGVENARRFIKMLTNVGKAVTDAMQVLADMNREINDLHLQLDTLDKEITAIETSEQVEPELEPETNKA